MDLIKENGKWIARVSFQNRQCAKSLGFRWCPDEKSWWTDDPVKARNFSEKYQCKEIDQSEDSIDLPDSYEGHASLVTDGPDDIPSPPGLTYMPFQRGGIAYARGKNGILIADEMGLGKTIQAIGIMNDDPIETALIICPASLKLNWEHELDKWLNYYRKVEVVSKIWNRGRHIYIINYDMLIKHKKHIDAIDWDILICDESQNLRNITAKRTQMVFGDSKSKPINAKKKIFLSGTPIENKPVELFPTINALRPDLFPDRDRFILRYCKGQHTPWGLKSTGASNLEELQFKLRDNCMVRRMKKDVLHDLPDKQHQIISFECFGDDRAVIDEEMKAYEKSVSKLQKIKVGLDMNTEEGKSIFHKQESEIKARIAAARKESTKVLLPMAIDYIKNSSKDNKVIVFCYHKFVMNELKKEFKGNSVSISGDTPNEMRKENVDRFQNDPDIKLFLGQIKAAGTGLTLTASRHVIFIERDSQPGLMNQAEDRAHRIGQKNNVLITHCVLENSYDQVMLNNIDRKSKMISKILN